MTDNINDIYAEIERDMTECGVQPNIRDRVLSQLRFKWGGQRVYLRRRDAAKTDLIITEGIKRGDSVADISRRSGASPATIYRRRYRDR